MLIDSKIVKRLNFPFCKTNAIYLLVDYMERNTEIQAMQQRIPFLIDFMEWQFTHDYRLLNQDGLNEFLVYLYEKNSFNYAESICSYIKSFCKYLMNEGFCGFVSFSSKPRKDGSKENEADKNHSDSEKDNCEKDEQQKKRRGRPKKEQQCNKTESQTETNESKNPNNPQDGDKQAKKRRGRKPKSSQNETKEDEQTEHKTNDNDDEKEQTKKRRGRPRKSDQNKATQSESEKSNASDTETGEKKRRGRPPKSSTPKLKRVTNYYDFLGVSPDADLDEIKKVYRKLALEMHPDLHGNDPMAEKRITSLNIIMSVLKDDVERMVYDVAMGFIEYDESMEHVTYKEIKWYTKRHYTVWI